MLSSCGLSDPKVTDIESLILKVSNKSNTCGSCINPQIRVHESDSSYIVESNEMKLLSNMYQYDCKSSKYSIASYSVHLNPRDAKVIRTCDFPKRRMQSSESTTTLFGLTKKGNLWVINSEESMN